MSEDYLIHYCAPTLAGIKTASLFCCPYDSRELFTQRVRELNKRLVPKGLRIIPLRFTKKKALMYVYRPSCLKRDLSDALALRLLSEKGYSADSCEARIAQLSHKIRNSADFPHEIGLFLGYPPEDVAGFMENNACNSKFAGCWKVYGNPETARIRFDQYRKCNEVYKKCWQSGTTLDRLVIFR